jgi:nucleoside-diphosphate-sugar epimerase
MAVGSRVLVTGGAGFIGRRLAGALLELARQRGVRALLFATGILAAWTAVDAGPLILGSGQSVTVSDIVEAARSVTGAELPAEHVPPKRREMPAVIVNISAARTLGYAPRFDLKASIATVWPEFSETAR